MLISLELIPLQQFASDQIHLLVKFFVKPGPVSFLTLTKRDTVLNTETYEVNRRKAKVSASSCDAITLRENATEDTRTATHSCDFRTIITWLVILQVERCVDKDKVREQALRADFHTLLKQIVVRIFGVIVHAFLDLEN